MPDLVLVLNEIGRPRSITVIDGDTGDPMNLTAKGVTAATLKVVSTDYVTTVLNNKSLVISSPTVAPQLTWNIVTADWTSWTAAGAYYGMVDMTGAGVDIPTLQFDISVMRKL